MIDDEINISVTKRTVSAAGSCNFCLRLKEADVSSDPPVFIYPYSMIHEVSGSGAVCVRFCHDCLIAMEGKREILDESSAIEIITDFVAAFHRYEMDVDGPPTTDHKKMMERAKEFLSHNKEISGLSNSENADN